MSEQTTTEYGKKEYKPVWRISESILDKKAGKFVVVSIECTNQITPRVTKNSQGETINEQEFENQSIALKTFIRDYKSKTDYNDYRLNIVPEDYYDLMHKCLKRFNKQDFDKPREEESSSNNKEKAEASVSV
ncbi:hypothetical protein GF336_00330 [Candidatus Woesearchaeota archaeon]|nr:hypothetical protein [Candidatus Woesearchaeota archaeon]